MRNAETAGALTCASRDRHRKAGSVERQTSGLGEGRPKRVGELAPRGRPILLAAGLQRVGRELHPAAGQRAAHQGGARPQERRQGCPVDRRPVAPRAAAGQLRARPGAAGVAGSDPLSDGAGARAGVGSQSAAEGAGRSQHQAGVRGHRRSGGLGTRDARGPGGGDGRCGDAGGVGARQAAGEDPPVAAGIGGTLWRPSPVLGRPAAGAHRLPRFDD
jgi:hypothetical protein